LFAFEFGSQLLEKEDDPSAFSGVALIFRHCASLLSFFLEVQSLFWEVGDFVFADSGHSEISLQPSVESVEKSSFSGSCSFVSTVFQRPVRLYFAYESCFADW
jgi:hypothetical protein